MARKITMNGHFRKSVAEVFEEFVMSKTAQGVSEITISTYRQHLRSISNHLDIQNIIFASFGRELQQARNHAFPTLRKCVVFLHLYTDASDGETANGSLMFYDGCRVGFCFGKFYARIENRL